MSVETQARAVLVLVVSALLAATAATRPHRRVAHVTHGPATIMTSPQCEAPR